MDLTIFFFLFYPVLCFFIARRVHIYLHSFPTRRSSDLLPRGWSAHRGVATTSSPSAPTGWAASPPRSSAASWREEGDRKSTRLNSSHGSISYAVFCSKKKTCRVPNAAAHPHDDRRAPQS